MIAALKLAWAYKELIIIGLLVAALGVTYHLLTVAEHERDVLALEKKERATRDAMRDATNLRNKERTDAETVAARRRAAAVVVRATPAGINPGKPFNAAGGGDGAVLYFDRGRFDDELAGWAARAAGRLTAVLRRDAERLEGVARAGEGVAADYRACRAWALNLVDNAPGAGEGAVDVGGVVPFPARARLAFTLAAPSTLPAP